jgi:outer membrane lipoprotein-sorting protein
VRTSSEEGATERRGRRRISVSITIFFQPAGPSFGIPQRAMRHRRGPPIPAAVVLLATLTVLSAGLSQVDAAEDRGLSIMEEQRRINGGYRDEFVLYKMTLVNAKGDRSDRSLEQRTLEGHDAGDKILLIFRDPPDVRGTTLLIHENRAGDDDQWLYLPALRRSRRIASSNKSSSFVGSEFAYEDLTPNEVTKHEYKYLREETLDGVPVWVIESVPRFKDSGYSRRELFVRRDNHQMARVNGYDRKGQLLKVGRWDGWWKVMDKRWRARSLRIENVQTGKSTILEVIDVKIGNGYSPSEFSTRALEG